MIAASSNPVKKGFQYIRTFIRRCRLAGIGWVDTIGLCAKGLVSSNKLTPADYDRLETIGTIDFPHFALRAYAPIAFRLVGFPTQISSPAGVLRYADDNFFAPVPQLFGDPKATFPLIGYVNAFTPDEAALCKEIGDKIADRTERDFGRPLRPVSGLALNIAPFRVLDALKRVRSMEKLRIFEAGPGNGLLGAMAIARGHEYVSYDVTQGMYLWQNYLFNLLAPNEFSEYAIPLNEKRGRNSRVIHLPWWHFHKSVWSPEFKADIVYSNGNLCEMNRMALKEFAHVAWNMLDETNLGLLMFFAPGDPSQSTIDGVESLFQEIGYHKVLSAPFHAFAKRPDGYEWLTGAFKDGIPHYNPSAQSASLTANDVGRFSRAEAPLDVELTQWHLGWKPPFTD